MTSNGTARGVRLLTRKEREFVQLLLTGHGKSDAYRVSYRTNADPHTVSAMACALAKRPAVRAAVSLAESGNWGALTSCGLSSDFVMWKKWEAEANNPAVKPYVRIQAGRLARKYQAEFELRAAQEAERDQRLLEAFKEFRQYNETLPPKPEFDDDLTLD